MTSKYIQFWDPERDQVHLRLTGQNDAELQMKAETIVRREWEGAEDILAEELEGQESVDWLDLLNGVVANYTSWYTVAEGTIGSSLTLGDLDKLSSLY